MFTTTSRSLTSLSTSATRHLTPPLHRAFSISSSHSFDYTHTVIGGGCVGLSIARSLASRPNTSTLLIERHSSVGTETSSRNSEVIHAGLYYGHETLKTELCLKGKAMLYSLCSHFNIPHRRTGKWIVAQDKQQMGELEKVHSFAGSIGVPTQFLSNKEIKEREPDVLAEAGVLESPSTGIIDSHSLMSYLEGNLQYLGGECVFNTSVVGIDPLNPGYRVHVTSKNGEQFSIDTETLINSAGLAAIPISNMLLPKDRHRKPYYAKGSYFSYSSSKPKPKTLLYPAPVPGHGGLGTHLTLDMAGNIRFGPDVEWITDPTDLSINATQLDAAKDMITTYLPNIDRDAIGLDYCGIRPKLGKTSGTAGPDFADFYIKEEEGYHGFVNLLGIESPGLTSSLAIGEMVEDILYGSETGQKKEPGEKGEEPRFEFHH